MIRFFQLPKYIQEKATSISELLETKDKINLDKIVWIDLQNPSKKEIEEVEEHYDISFPTKQEQEEIEVSSRYLEDAGNIKINSTFTTISPGSRKLEEHEISFIITKNRLFTLRYFDSRVLSETVKKIKQFPGIYTSPIKIFISILESRIDYDADLIELVSKYVAGIGKQLTYTKSNPEEDIFYKISECQELTMSLREALFDKQRVLSLLLRSNEDIMEGSENRLRIIIKDINSLIEHANFNFTRLEYLQYGFVGLVNIDQNKIIKIFTVASLVFMPPTLIASIYGMNFRAMPELDWAAGYPFTLFLMFVSSMIPLAFFKKKKWL
jgi:magnesium transporter